VVTGVLGHDLFERLVLRVRRLVQVPVVLRGPEIEVRFGAVRKITERSGLADGLDRR